MSSVQNMTYFIVVLFIQIDSIHGESITSIATTTSTPRLDSIEGECSLDNASTFGLSLTYAGVSLIALIGVSLWSFKSIPGLHLKVYICNKNYYTNSEFICVIYNRFESKIIFKDLRSKKKCFFPVIATIFDQSSDIGFIFGMYGVMISDSCPNVNGLYLFLLSLLFFLFYRVASAIMVFIGTKNICYAIGQFLFEYMLYRSIHVNYRLKCKEPSSGQQ